MHVKLVQAKWGALKRPNFVQIIIVVLTIVKSNTKINHKGWLNDVVNIIF